MCPGREGSRKLLLNCEVNAEQPGPSNASTQPASSINYHRGQKPPSARQHNPLAGAAPRHRLRPQQPQAQTAGCAQPGPQPPGLLLLHEAEVPPRHHRRQKSSEKRSPGTLLEVTKITSVRGKQRAAGCKALVATGQSRRTVQVVLGSRCPANRHTACAPLARPCVPGQGCVHLQEWCLVLLCTKALYELAAETPPAVPRAAKHPPHCPTTPRSRQKRASVC